jgi:predicted MFS family arabinose efflux permease
MPLSGPSKPINERRLFYTLAAVQFTHIMDFMIMMPLGPQFRHAFGITPTQFGFSVSVYTFSAGLPESLMSLIYIFLGGLCC